jgi:hypothetical protein
MTDLATTVRPNWRAWVGRLPRGVVVIGLALSAWLVMALLIGLVLRGLALV